MTRMVWRDLVILFLLFCSPPSCHPWILAHHIYTSEYRANSNSQKKKKQKKKQVESPTAYHPETVTAWWEYENGTVPFGKRHKIPAKQNRNKNVKNCRKIKMATSLKLISVILYTPLPHRPHQPSSTASFDQHGYIVLYNASYRCNCVMKCPPNSIFFSSQFCCCCFFFHYSFTHGPTTHSRCTPWSTAHITIAQYMLWCPIVQHHIHNVYIHMFPDELRCTCQRIPVYYICCWLVHTLHCTRFECVYLVNLVERQARTNFTI